ncbi:hypothetical protein HPB51_022655 [Rhipicephalus microplus]|uniref:Tick transposon n=1 Tax=Rhipicephalus microplus TaxID=6941 RepID=A0A9J6E3J8_RHIMP|nr:hypothetical protein HPB51_022655 [Rhipicephalus microplus]
MDIQTRIATSHTTVRMSAAGNLERLQLEIFRVARVKPLGVRGSATSIDYALASDGLVKVFQRLHIDEEGTHSIGSDHNRLRLDFSKAYHRGSNTGQRGTPTRYLPGVPLQTVAEQFEASPQREEAKTYEEYVSELCRIMEMHKVWGGIRPARHHRKPWWDKEVAAALPRGMPGEKRIAPIAGQSKRRTLHKLTSRGSATFSSSATCRP